MNTPVWYMTTEEFTSIIVDTLDDQGHFKRDAKFHPEDIQYAIESVTRAIALGAMAAGEKIGYTNRKNSI